MLNSLLQPSERRSIRPSRSHYASIRTISFHDDDSVGQSERRPFLRYRHDHLETEEESENTEHANNQEEEDEGTAGSNDVEEDRPLLPIFSSVHLDVLPVFAWTRAFREMVTSRCDTVLSWEQLRSPQVSQFLVKPIQQEIRATHFGAATEYALLANCLQFSKEATTSPGNSGVNNTRAMVCELIAIKLLREYTTTELIDALSYDFDPLQGQMYAEPQGSGIHGAKKPKPKSARISCLEIALRARSKRFLAHPLVVQHLEAIWNGAIVFHAAADSMHRRRPFRFSFQHVTYGSTETPAVNQIDYSSRSQKVVTLYNPREASLFKLSRLRVPRYRNILSTISFAVLLGLFLAVLTERSVEITTLEVVFWFWAAGYMLDEVIGFNEQGFSLYIASFWNTFDVGIVILLVIHLFLRLYGIIVPTSSQTKMAYWAYDVLAADAILLFPRLFSVLDHYRYFSQLIIAFRMMATDMIAIFVLIIVFCSGFLVALTLAFGNGDVDTPSSVAYALLQLFMGFTPAAWDRWVDYNYLGRTVLALFMFICHFVIVTILVTVMTNSFMEVVRNANEEHQFLFAVNTISSVKSDALFAYVPPANVLQWMLTPLKSVMPLRDYIRLNRTIIKGTHFPILFTIYIYERFILGASYADSVDIVENRGRIQKTFTQKLPRLMREPSIATFRQDAALAEVFKRPVDATFRTGRSQERRKTSNVVNTWMRNIGDDNTEPPQDEDRKMVEGLESKRRGLRRIVSSQKRDFSVGERAISVVSDPNDFASHADFFSPPGPAPHPVSATPSVMEITVQQTDADGDDELHSDDDEDDTNVYTSDVATKKVNRSTTRPLHSIEYFKHRAASSIGTPDQQDSRSSAASRHRFLASPVNFGSPRPIADREKRPAPQHMRTTSSATMIFNPTSKSEQQKADGSMQEQLELPYIDIDEDGDGSGSKNSPLGVVAHAPARKTPKRLLPPKMRPFLPTQDNLAFRSSPDLGNALNRPRPQNKPSEKPRRNSLEMDLVSDIGDNKAIGGGYVGAIPASFATQMALATGALRQSQQRQQDSDMFGRLMMARMNTLEEGFREVVHEVRESIKQVGAGSRPRSPERPANVPLRIQHRERKKTKDKQKDGTNTASLNTSTGNSVFGSEGDKEAQHAQRPATSGSGSTSGKGNASNKENSQPYIPKPAPEEHHRPQTAVYVKDDTQEQ